MSENKKQETQESGNCPEPEQDCAGQERENGQAQPDTAAEDGEKQTSSPGPDDENNQQGKSREQQLEEQIAQLNDRFLRTRAEYDNFRKRSVKEKQAVYPQATAAAVAGFVPILDNFERALSAPCTDEEFKKGVSMIFQSFRDAVHKLGVEEFAEAGDEFNPDMHNAVMHIEDEEQQANVIVEVFQKGYKLGERIIRHAMVKVAN